MSKRPNVILILADDMGYSDLGFFGGDIETPNLDQLAKEGQTYTQFYNTARCCPTRASLLTGLHPHQTGIGHMTNTPVNKTVHDLGIVGYRGFLNHNCVTIPELLAQEGYHTYMSGKWHLGEHEDNQWPTNRGFQRFYGIRAGACNYMRPMKPNGLFLQNEVVIPDHDYYSTDAFTDYAMKFIAEREDHNPFFLYLAYNAPHWPLQAPKEDVEKYRGRYMSGWDAVRRARYEHLLKNGILTVDGCKLSPRDADVPGWETLTHEQQVEMDYRMATYAAQVDRMDQNIGRLTNYLKQIGELDDTLILFLSDNGGCAEGGILGSGDVTELNTPDISKLMISYGQAWANVSNTPFRLYKHFVHEGGISTPLIAHYPNGIAAYGLNREPAYLIDIMPTILQLAHAGYPDTAFGNSLPPLEGKSLTPIFKTGERSGHEYMFWEHEYNCSVRFGHYKALQKYNTGEWELYDLAIDRSELNNIASQHPDVVDQLAAKWLEWANSHYVRPKKEELHMDAAENIQP